MLSIKHSTLFLVILTSLTVQVCGELSNPPRAEKPPEGLDALYKKLLKKQEAVKNSRLIEFINRGAPSGVDAPVPAIAEYETFRSDKSVNFLNDGSGHIVFRQFRRIRISDLLGSRSRRTGLQV